MLNYVDEKKIKEHDKNSYYFTDVEGEKYEEIRRSIEENGIRDPIKVMQELQANGDSRFIVISGHQRLRIARDIGLGKVPVQVIPDISEEDAEYLLIAENVERRGQAETDPIKKSRIANFLKEYWEVQDGKPRHNVGVKTTSDIGMILGADERTTQRIMKLNDLIPELQDLVSEGKLGTTAGEQLAHMTEDNQRALLDVLGDEIERTTVAKAKEYRSVEQDSAVDNYEEKLIDLQRAKEQAEERAEQARQSEEIALKKLEEEQAKEPKVVEKEVVKEVEVIPDDVLQKIEKYENELSGHEGALKELEELQERVGDVEKYEKEIRALNKKKNSVYDEYAELMGKYRELQESEDVATQRAGVMNTIGFPLSKLREKKTDWEELLKSDVELDRLTVNRIRIHADFLEEMRNILLMYIAPYTDDVEVEEKGDFIDVEGVVID